MAEKILIASGADQKYFNWLEWLVQSAQKNCPDLLFIACLVDDSNTKVNKKRLEELHDNITIYKMPSPRNAKAMTAFKVPFLNQLRQAEQYKDCAILWIDADSLILDDLKELRTILTGAHSADFACRPKPQHFLKRLKAGQTENKPDGWWAGVTGFGNSQMAKDLMSDYYNAANNNTRYEGNQTVLKKLFEKYRDKENFKYQYLDYNNCFWEFERRQHEHDKPNKCTDQCLADFKEITSEVSIVSARRPGQSIAKELYPKMLIEDSGRNKE